MFIQYLYSYCTKIVDILNHFHIDLCLFFSLTLFCLFFFFPLYPTKQTSMLAKSCRCLGRCFSSFVKSLAMTPSCVSWDLTSGNFCRWEVWSHEREGSQCQFLNVSSPVLLFSQLDKSVLLLKRNPSDHSHIKSSYLMILHIFQHFP